MEQMEIFKSFRDRVAEAITKMIESQNTQSKIEGEASLRIFSQNDPELKERLETSGGVLKTVDTEGETFYICTF